MQMSVAGDDATRVQPYAGLARLYDRVMGDALFPLICRSFERALEDFDIRFRSAADVGCGTGTFLHYLSRYRVPLYGVDRSAAMLRVAARKTRGLGVLLLRQDMTKLRLPHPVDLITCNADTLNYLRRPEAVQAAFYRCRDNLTSGGHVMFDLITGAMPERRQPSLVQRIRLPGTVSQWNLSIDPVRRRTVVDMRSIYRGHDGRYRREQEVHVQRWYPVPEVRRLLQEVGLTLLGMLEADSAVPATSRSFWVKFVARRL